MPFELNALLITKREHLPMFSVCTCDVMKDTHLDLMLTDL